jgi:hypothetical protein
MTNVDFEGMSEKRRKEERRVCQRHTINKHCRASLHTKGDASTFPKSSRKLSFKRRKTRHVSLEDRDASHPQAPALHVSTISKLYFISIKILNWYQLI